MKKKIFRSVCKRNRWLVELKRVFDLCLLHLLVIYRLRIFDIMILIWIFDIYSDVTQPLAETESRSASISRIVENMRIRE